MPASVLRPRPLPHSGRRRPAVGTALLCALAVWLAAGGAVAPRASAAPGAGTAATPAAEAPGVAEQVIVQVHAGVTAERLAVRVGRLGFTLLRALDDRGRYLLRVPPGQDVPTAVVRLQALPEVRAAAPNYLTVPPGSPGPARPHAGARP